MNAQKPHSRKLVVAGIILVFLVMIAFVASFLTQRISQNMIRQAPIITGEPTPTPKEHAIYLNLPKSFPRDFPLPQDAKVSAAKEDATQWTAVLTTVAQIDQVSRFFTTELPHSGWAITNESRAAGLTIIYSRKGKQEALVAIGKGDGGITVSITILK